VITLPSFTKSHNYLATSELDSFPDTEMQDHTKITQEEERGEHENKNNSRTY
jgi:hypothetical protein